MQYWHVNSKYAKCSDGKQSQCRRALSEIGQEKQVFSLENTRSDLDSWNKTASSIGFARNRVNLSEKGFPS